MNSIFLTIFQTIIVFALAPFTLGLVRTLKARLQGRHGASPFLPYVSFATLLRKQMVISESTSWVFRAVPFVVLFSTAFLTVVLPLVGTGGIFSSYSHFVLVAGVLALGAIFLVLGGLDVASAFGGMGSSREMTITALLEPSIIVIFATLALLSGSFNIDEMFALGALGHWPIPLLLLPIASFLMILLAENARYPVDNPATHLELTMVHEAMVLEYSGPYLAMLEYAASLKLTIFSILLTNIIFPTTIVTVGSEAFAFVLAPLVTILKVMVVMFLLAVLESSIAKMRFYRMQEYLTGAYLLALFGMIFTLIYQLV